MRTPIAMCPGDRVEANVMSSKSQVILLASAAAAITVIMASCGTPGKVQANNPGGPGAGSSEVSVGVVKIARKNLGRTLTLSSELVPFQEIDVYAKESGFVKQLFVDYGSRVQANQILATLEIPELQLQVKQDEAAIKNASDQIKYAQNLVSRAEASTTCCNCSSADWTASPIQARLGRATRGRRFRGKSSGLRRASRRRQVEPAVGREPVASRSGQTRARSGSLRLFEDHSALCRHHHAALRHLGTLLQAGTSSSTQQCLWCVSRRTISSAW